MYYVFSFLNPATLKGKLKYSIKTDILLTNSYRPCLVAHGGTYNPTGSGTYNFSQTGVGRIIFGLRNFGQMRNLVIYIYGVILLRCFMSYAEKHLIVCNSEN